MIPFPTSLKYCLVYFQIYLKKNSYNFLVLFLKLCINSIFLNRIFGERRKLSKVLECTLPPHNLKAIILNPGIILCVSFDTVRIPPRHREPVILCDDMFKLVSAYWWFHAIGVWYIWDSTHHHMPFMHTGRNPRKPLSWVDTSLSSVFVETDVSGMA